jgi:hypothetical protein
MPGGYGKVSAAPTPNREQVATRSARSPDKRAAQTGVLSLKVPSEVDP